MVFGKTHSSTPSLGVLSFPKSVYSLQCRDSPKANISVPERERVSTATTTKQLFQEQANYSVLVVPLQNCKFHTHAAGQDICRAAGEYPSQWSREALLFRKGSCVFVNERTLWFVYSGRTNYPTGLGRAVCAGSVCCFVSSASREIRESTDISLFQFRGKHPRTTSTNTTTTARTKSEPEIPSA